MIHSKVTLWKMLAIPVLVLGMAFVFAGHVHAQDIVPTDPVPVTDPAPVVVTDTPAEAPQSPDAAPVDAPAVVADLPAEVTLVDSAGEPIVVASEQAADASAVVDPWFMVGTAKYNFTVADCDPGLGVVPCAQPLQAAVDYIHNNGKIPSDGFIHVDAGEIPNQKVIVDGSQAYLNSLKGIVGHVSTTTYTPDAVLSLTGGSGSYISVINKTNGFTLTGLNITVDTSSLTSYGAVDFSNNTGAILLQDLVLANTLDPAGYGIMITNQTGGVTVKNVNVQGGVAGGGAYIDNSSGTAGVTITNSAFDDKAGSNSFIYPGNGVHIITKGAVLLTNVSASRNAGTNPGLWIQGGTTVTIKSSLIIGNTAGGGIDIRSNTSTVSLSNVTAEGNFQTGLYVRTGGAITLTGIDISNNYGAGAYGANLFNASATSALGVTITNATFVNNYTTGLYVGTKGNIILTNTSSWGNDGTAGSYGAYLDNLGGTTGYVKITNLPSTDDLMQPGFDFNHDRGLDIHTRGTVTLTNVNVSSNQEEGIYVWQDFNKGVTMTNCRVDNNGLAGIYVNTIGPIVINGGHANNNSAYGVRVRNETTPDAAPKPVTISNFTANFNNGYGVYVQSKGAITLTNVQASYTTGALLSAIDLNNSWLLAGITLTRVTAEYNNNTGISLNTLGAVKMTTIAANYNSNGYGAFIGQAAAPSGYPTVTVTMGSFCYNHLTGLYLDGRGAVTLKDIKADYNIAGRGAYLTNDSGNVTLLASTTGGNSFSYNGGGNYDGLDIVSQGVITLNNVTANYNSGHVGAFLYYTPTGNVIINGGTFSHEQFGVVVYSKGTIAVNNVVAEGNAGFGIYLDNTYDTTGTKGITITRTAVNYNGTGIGAQSYGLITINKIDARYNTGYGVSLDNNFGALLAPKGVTVLSSYGISNFSNNGSSGTYSGLYIHSRGSITITGVIADYNTNRGVDLDESAVTNPIGKITLTNITTRRNLYSGIYIDTILAVTGNTLTSNYNGWPIGSMDGLTIYGHSSGKAVTISNSVFMENAFVGLWCSGVTGTFTLYNVVAVGNWFANIWH